MEVARSSIQTEKASIKRELEVQNGIQDRRRSLGQNGSFTERPGSSRTRKKKDESLLQSNKVNKTKRTTLNTSEDRKSKEMLSM